MGFMVGDALGVPHEFRSRDDMRSDPATGMAGHGSHNQPPGTWSDDSSLMLCVLENCHRQETARDLGLLFLRWYDEGYHTAHGEVFDIGMTTERALERQKEGKPLKASEVDGRRSSRNGRLMRSLPYAFLEDFRGGVTPTVEEGLITHPGDGVGLPCDRDHDLPTLYEVILSVVVSIVWGFLGMVSK